MREYASLEEFLSELPQLAQPAQGKLRGHDGLYAFQLPEETYFIRLEDGLVTVSASAPEAPTCTITAGRQQLLDLLNGRANPMKALLLGRVRVNGDKAALLRLLALL